MKKKSSNKKKKILIKKMKIISFLVIILASLILLLCFVFGKPKLSKAMNTVNTYMSYINDAKYDEMYSMISNTSNISKDEFIDRNKTIYESLEANSVTLSNMSEEEENRKN